MCRLSSFTCGVGLGWNWIFFNQKFTIHCNSTLSTTLITSKEELRLTWLKIRKIGRIHSSLWKKRLSKANSPYCPGTRAKHLRAFRVNHSLGSRSSCCCWRIGFQLHSLSLLLYSFLFSLRLAPMIVIIILVADVGLALGSNFTLNHCCIMSVIPTYFTTLMSKLEI